MSQKILCFILEFIGAFLVGFGVGQIVESYKKEHPACLTGSIYLCNGGIICFVISSYISSGINALSIILILFLAFFNLACYLAIPNSFDLPVKKRGNKNDTD